MSDFVTQEEFRVVCLGLLDAQNRIAKLEAKLLAVGGGQYGVRSVVHIQPHLQTHTTCVF